MARQADGTVYIDNVMDTSDVEAGSERIKNAIKKTVEIVNKMGDASKASMKEVKNMLSQNIDVGNLETVQDRVDRTLDALKLLEGKGLNFGDSEFDEVYKKFLQADDSLKQYKKDLAEAALPVKNPFGLDTLSGKIFEAQKNLDNLVKAGYSIESLEFKEAYQNLAQLKELQKEYLAEIGKTPKQRQKDEARINAELQKIEQLRAKEVEAAMEANRLKAIGENAEISDQHIVDLNNELSALKERQADLGKAGLGLGYAEFDQNSIRIAEINQELREYGALLTNNQPKQSLFSKSLKKIENAAKLAAKEILGLEKNTKKTDKSFASGLKTLLKYGLGIRSIFVLVNKLRRALVEGFKNLAQYSDTTNASISSVKSALTQLKNSLATAFDPILSVAAPALTKLINILSKAVTYLGMFIAALTGQSSFTRAIGVQEDYAASLENTASAAQKANKYLSGLDEIRTYSDNKDSSNGGGYTAPTPGEMFETVPIENKVKEFADKVKKTFSKMFSPMKKAWDKYGDSIKQTLKKTKDNVVAFGEQIVGTTVEWFAGLNWAPFLKSVDTLLTKLEPLTNIILNGLAWAYENVLLPLSKWTIEELLPVNIENLGKAFEFVRVAIEQLQPVFMWLWQNILVPFGRAVGDIVIGILTALGGVLDFLIGVFTGDWERAFQGLQTIAEGFRNAVFSVFEFIESLLNNFDSFLQGVFAIDWANSFGLLGNILNDFFDFVEVIWKYIQGLFEGFIQFFRGVFTGNWKEAWEGIKKIFSSILDAVVGIAKVGINCIKDVFNFGWNSIRAVTSSVFNGIVSTIKNSVNSIIGFINGMISGVVSGINTMINAFNSLSFNIPDWVPGIGGKTFGFSIPTISAPQIPYLATGAVIPPNAPFLAMLGDQKNGKNLEMPEKLLRQVIREEMGNNSRGGNGQISLQVVLNRRVIYEEMIEEAKLRQTVTGKNCFRLGF